MPTGAQKEVIQPTGVNM